MGLAANSAIQQGPEGATRILELSNEVYEAMARAEEAEERVLTALENIEAVAPTAEERESFIRRAMSSPAGGGGSDGSDEDAEISGGGYTYFGFDSEAEDAPQKGGGIWDKLVRRAGRGEGGER